METLIQELNKRHQAVKNKTGTAFIIAVLDYLKLLEHFEIQEILLQQKNDPIIHELNIWPPYQKLQTEVYQPHQQHPALFKKTFAHFYVLEDWYDFPIVLFFTPKGIKAMWRKFLYRKRVDAIHSRLPTLLRNKQFLSTEKPIKRLEFSEQKSILYLNQFEIQINRHSSITDQHRILAFMFKHENSDQEFFYAEMAEEVFGDEEYQKNPRRYWEACEAINEKVAKATKGLFPKFLIATLGKQGLVKINPDCWALFR